jgi:hypothetical protein
MMRNWSRAFCWRKGFIESRDDLDEIRRVCGRKDAPEPNVSSTLYHLLPGRIP